jgi:alanine racemase
VKHHSSVSISIDYARVRLNAETIAGVTGVPVHAVVKANAYGLGAVQVIEAIQDIVDGFCVFGLAEAQASQICKIAQNPILCIGPPGDATADDYIALHARPAVSTIEEARRLRAASPVLCVDTGMQRFACPAENVVAALEAGDCREAFTHATRIDQVKRLIELVGGRDRGLMLHAAGTTLLNDPQGYLDAVRPGLALYRGAVRLAAKLVEVRDSRGPAGYSGFESPRHGVILVGYTHGLRRGPCLVNGRRSRILEVGMQSAFVEAAANDRLGDEVVLIGDGLEADEIGAEWKASPPEVLVSLLR